MIRIKSFVRAFWQMVLVVMGACFLIVGLFFIAAFLEIAGELSAFPKYYVSLWHDSGLAVWKVIVFHLILAVVGTGFWLLNFSTRINGPRSDAARQADAIISAIRSHPPH